MDSEVICNPKNYDSLTHSVNNTGLRDASASKNTFMIHFCSCTFEYKLLNLLKDKGAAFFTRKEWILLRISSVNTLYKTGKISSCVCKGVPCQEQQEGKKTNQVWCLNQHVILGMEFLSNILFQQLPGWHEEGSGAVSGEPHPHERSVLQALRQVSPPRDYK